MDRLEEYRTLIERELKKLLPDLGGADDGLRRGERYSLLAGGKRIRPVLTLEFNRVCGGNILSALPAACAIEMVHTYSLVHDDLPCMDNDTLRRGKPTNHVVFGECNATLAGDALLTDAFSVLLGGGLSPERAARCAAILADAAGSRGMCAGQYLDTNPEAVGTPTREKLEDIYAKKTGAMLSAACRMGAASAGAAREQEAAAAAFGMKLGLAFQIRDDILDVTSSAETLGKTPGTDERDGKTTMASLMGVEECVRLLTELTGSAIEELRAFEDSDFLCRIAESLASREK